MNERKLPRRSQLRILFEILRRFETRIRSPVLHRSFEHVVHERILGRREEPDSSDVRRTQQLFADIVAEARDRKAKGVKDEGPKSNFTSANDPNYTIRAWSGVVTYLLRRPEFLYE